MDIIQVCTVIGIALANIGTTISLFIWSTNRTEENRKELNSSIQELGKQTNRLIEAIQLEMKDFHGRLCSIEERNKAR